MKFLVVAFTGLVAAALATPLEPGYGLPAAPPVAVAPIETVTLPVAPVAIEPPFLARSAVPFARAVPFAPSPVARALGPAPLPFARRFFGPAPLAGAPVPRALPLTGPAPFPRALPVASPLPRALPLPAAAPAPLARALPAGPAPFPLPLAAAGPAPLPLVRSPVAALAPAAPISVPSSQFHAQDELGGFNFGYQNQDSNRQEIHTPDGVTRGSYSYVDAFGLPQTVNYVADALGFRVEATNLPVAPNGAPGVAVPQDTAEVRAAKADFQAAFDRAVAEAQAEAVLEVAEDAPLVLKIADEEAAPLVLARRKRQTLTEGYGVPAAPVVVAAPAPVPAVVQTRRLFSAPIAPLISTPLVRSSLVARTVAPVAPFPAPLARALPATGLLPVGPAPVLPGPVRTIPAAAAEVRTPLTATAPLVPTPLVNQAVIPAAPVVANTQYHAQDELGGFSFGYQGLTSGRQESRTPDGVTRGSYSYVDANGVTQTVNYVADALGFRVAATNLPVA